MSTGTSGSPADVHAAGTGLHAAPRRRPDNACAPAQQVCAASCFTEVAAEVTICSKTRTQPQLLVRRLSNAAFNSQLSNVCAGRQGITAMSQGRAQCASAAIAGPRTP